MFVYVCECMYVIIAIMYECVSVSFTHMHAHYVREVHTYRHKLTHIIYNPTQFLHSH